MTPLDRLRLWRDLTAERDDLIREAYGDGVPVPRIVEATGISRAMVYRVLERK